MRKNEGLTSAARRGRSNPTKIRTMRSPKPIRGRKSTERPLAHSRPVLPWASASPSCVTRDLGKARTLAWVQATMAVQGTRQVPLLLPINESLSRNLLFHERAAGNVPGNLFGMALVERLVQLVLDTNNGDPVRDRPRYQAAIRRLASLRPYHLADRRSGSCHGGSGDAPIAQGNAELPTMAKLPCLDRGPTVRLLWNAGKQSSPILPGGFSGSSH